MDSRGRHIHPSLSELIDRLTVDQIKEILVLEGRNSFGKEMERIQHDLDWIFSRSDYRLSARLIRLIIALAQINLHIWKAKERMMSDPPRFEESLKLSHQLNGVRNQLKNEMLEETGVKERTLVKTNVNTEDLKGWDLSVLKNHGSAGPSDRAGRLEERHYRFPLADLIDTVAINQIKEVLLSGEKRLNSVREMEALALDIDLGLKERRVRLRGRLLGLIILLAQAHLLIWLNKDQMQKDTARYHRLLAFAQDLNGLRNQVRNILMDEFGELEACTARASFLSREKGKWYSPILKRLNGIPERHEEPLLAVTKDDLSLHLGIEEAELFPDCREILRTRDFAYRKLEGMERDGVIRSIVQRIVTGDFWVSGDDKQAVWEHGWRENLREYDNTKDLSRLMPKFLQSKKILRLGRSYIEPRSPDFEFDLIDIFRRWVLRKYLAEVKAIYEFGCGSGQHLPVLAELFPDKEIHGLDWAEASLEIIDKLVQDKGWKIKGHLFNLFSPDPGLPLGKGCGVFTVGTMEQLGKNFEPFLQFLITKGPTVVLHIESMAELYDENNLIDYLARIYDGKRNYLDGYIQRLRELKKEGKIEIVRIQRVYFGSMFHDSYSCVVWRPRPLEDGGGTA